MSIIVGGKQQLNRVQGIRKLTPYEQEFSDNQSTTISVHIWYCNNCIFYLHACFGLLKGKHEEDSGLQYTTIVSAWLYQNMQKGKLYCKVGAAHCITVCTHRTLFFTAKDKHLLNTQLQGR
jgi:hypothetical protein